MSPIQTEVEVYYPLESLWYWAVILDGPDHAGRYRVRYQDWGEGYDEWVAVDRVRPRREPGAGIACTAGEPIEASTYEGWVPATIVEGPDASGQYRVSMDGWDASYDRWVTRDKMRVRWTAANSAWPPAHAELGSPGPPDPTRAAGLSPGGSADFEIAGSSAFAAYAFLPAGPGRQARWVECGTVRTQEDGLGLEIQLDLLPVGGHLVIRKA